MEFQRVPRAQRRGLGLALRASVVSAVAALGLALGPVAAHAAETLSASGNGWGETQPAGLANAQTNAYWALYDLAHSRGEACSGITYVTTFFYPVPGAPYGYAYTVQATGTCS